MPEATLLAPYVTANPDVLGGKPCIAGHRISVWMVYEWHQLGKQSVDEIITDFPQLSHAKIYGALSYVWDHLDDYLAYKRQEAEVVEGFVREFPSRVMSIDTGNGDSISSR